MRSAASEHGIIHGSVPRDRTNKIFIGLKCVPQPLSHDSIVPYDCNLDGVVFIPAQRLRGNAGEIGQLMHVEEKRIRMDERGGIWRKGSSSLP